MAHPFPDFTPYELRPFQPADRAAVTELIGACYAEYDCFLELDTLDADLNRLEEVFVEPASALRVLTDGPKIIGSAGVLHKQGTEAELKRVFLDASYRGRGLGKRLSQWAFAYASRQGYHTLHIWSDTRFLTAHALYRRLGAEDTGRLRELGGLCNTWEYHFVKRLDG